MREAPSTVSALRERCSQAVRLMQCGDAKAALAVFDSVVAAAQRVSLPDLHVCLSNRSAAHLRLGQTEQALQDALQALGLIERRSLGVPLRQCDGYAQALRRLGDALAGLGLLDLAQDAYEEGLFAQPHHLALRQGLQSVLSQKLDTGPASPPTKPAHSTGSTPAADHADVVSQPDQAPCYSLVEAPGVGFGCGALARQDGVSESDKLLKQLAVRQPGLLPVHRQLSHRQAEVEVTTRDTINYLTIQSDIQVPRHLLTGYLQDTNRLRAVTAALTAAVDEVVSTRGCDCRVLVLGGAMGVLPLLALRAGAAHVTVIERWLYASLACKDLLTHHNVPEDRYKIVHGAVTDFVTPKELRDTVPVCCNVVVCDALVDDGVLTSGLSVCVCHALQHWTPGDAIVIPERVRVLCQPVEALTPDVGGVTLSAVDTLRYQSYPGLDRDGLMRPWHHSVTPLAHPVTCWEWDLGHMPDKPEARPVSLQAHTAGSVTSVATWCDVTHSKNIACVTSHNPNLFSTSATNTPPGTDAHTEPPMHGSAASRPHTDASDGPLHTSSATNTLYHRDTMTEPPMQDSLHTPDSNTPSHAEEAGTESPSMQGPAVNILPSLSSVQPVVHTLVQRKSVFVGGEIHLIAAHNTARLAFAWAADEPAAHTKPLTLPAAPAQTVTPTQTTEPAETTRPTHTATPAQTGVKPVTCAAQEDVSAQKQLARSAPPAQASTPTHTVAQATTATPAQTTEPAQTTRPIQAGTPTQTPAHASAEQEDVSVPRRYLVNACDTPLMTAYQEAIRDTLKRLETCGNGKGVHVLDLSAGAGWLGLFTALHSSSFSVTCVEAHPAMARICRRNAALSGVADRVCVLSGAYDAVRATATAAGMPKEGADLVLLNLLDESLLGFGALEHLSAAVRNRLVSPGAVVLPARVTMYCVGVEVLSRTLAKPHNPHAAHTTHTGSGDTAEPHPHTAHTGHTTNDGTCEGGDQIDTLLRSVDLAPLNRYWCDDHTQSVPVHVDSLPLTFLTPVFPLYEVDTAHIIRTGGDITAAVHPITTPPATNAHTHGTSHPSSTAAAQSAPMPSALGAHTSYRENPPSAAAAHSAGNETSAVDFFARAGKGGGLMLQGAAVRDGVVNAVLTWQSVYLSDGLVVTTAPEGVDPLGYGPTSTLRPCIDASNEQARSTKRVVRMASCRPTLQFAEHVMAARTGQPVQLVAQRLGGANGTRVVVDVRPAKAAKAPRPPWREEWGGGVSIENPHVQRVKYCELLESDLVQRLPSGRGPSVERDVRALAEHCGSLLLHPPAVMRSLRHLTLLERLYRPGSVTAAQATSLGQDRCLVSAADRWRVAVLAARKQQDLGQAGGSRSSPVRVVLDPNTQPAVNWRQVEGGACAWSV